MLEQNQQFLDKADDYLGDIRHKVNHCFDPSTHTDLIFMYFPLLSNNDRSYRLYQLNRCTTALKHKI